MIRRVLLARGEVQGVGFRPQVARLAATHGLAGFVRNEAAGVRVEVEGPREAVDAFVAALRALPPPVRLVALEQAEAPLAARTGFHIEASLDQGEVQPSLPPDLALCAACAAEVRDPTDRRHDHPFTSCTACGPRATIAGAPPFDRARSAMAGFPLCPACAAEHANPADRRYHAQTIACPACGPRLVGSLAGALDRAAAVLRAGGLVALKGVGGFQLLCDATDPDAVARVRAAKRRPDKPLAVMVADLAAAAALVGPLPAPAAALLAGPAGPIVLLPWDGRGLAPGVAEAELGLLLPTTPLHLRLLDRVGRPLVCTSGNPAGAPLATDRATAAADLGPAVDAWLDHDRPIWRPMDDSVVRCLAGTGGAGTGGEASGGETSGAETSGAEASGTEDSGAEAIVLRRARGLAPRPLALASGGPTVLATGAFLQAAPALLRGAWAHVAPHVGDLDERRTLARYAAELDHLLDLAPALDAVACDLHPDLPSTHRAEALAARRGVPLLRVQHHEAHVAAVLAEHDHTGPALGLAWDGVGLGHDGTAWGGEALHLDGGRATRQGALRSLPLPGGDRAAREPARVALGLLHDAGLLEHPAALPALDRARTALGTVADGTLALLASGLPPRTTAVGRLLDGLAFLLGGPAQASFEGQAAWWLEARATAPAPALPLPLHAGPLASLDWRPLVEALLDGLAAGRSVATLARGVHEALVQGALALAAEHPTVVLAGGCFQNRLLLAGCRAGLEARRQRVLTARSLPPGDGGLALGQGWLARHRLG